MHKHATSIWVLAGLISATAPLSSIYADTLPAANLGAIAQDQGFFSVGGPANTSGAAPAPEMQVAPANTGVLPDPTLFTQVNNLSEQHREHPVGQNTDAPMPDPSLFTQVSKQDEQTQDHAFNLFGRKKAAVAAAPAAVVVDANGQIVQAPDAAPPAPTASTGPDPSLFTQVPNPNEQTRDHPFTLF